MVIVRSLGSRATSGVAHLLGSKSRPAQQLRLAVVIGTVVAAGVGTAWAVPLSVSAGAHRSTSHRREPLKHKQATHRHGRPVAVPILMFHHVAPRREGSPLLWVTRRQLAAELAFLRRHGYRTVTLQQVYECWTTGSSLPAHPVVLSFDDGYSDQYRYAAPLLRRYHDVAVLNLIVHNLGRALTVADVSRMAFWGWEIDSHTITHRDLALLPVGVVRHELWVRATCCAATSICRSTSSVIPVAPMTARSSGRCAGPATWPRPR